MISQPKKVDKKSLNSKSVILAWGAFTYDVRFLVGRVGQAASDFTK